MKDYSNKILSEKQTGQEKILAGSFIEIVF